MSWDSLRLRLFLGALAAIVVALVMAGLAIVSSFSASIEAERRDDLSATIDRLTAAIDPSAPVLAVAPVLTDARYDTPLSGVYWEITDLDSGAVMRSRSLWDQDLNLRPHAAVAGAGVISEGTGPNGERLVMLTRDVTAEAGSTSRHFGITVAEARTRDDDPVARFNSNLIIALGVLGAVLLIAAVLQVHFGLRPLTGLDEAIRAVREGRQPRLPQTRTSELMPITEQVNELLDTQEETITFARHRAADLAHGLKTPLAILSATAARLRAANDAANADVLDMLTEQMNGRIDYQLRVARLRPRTHAMGASASLNDVLLRSVAVLRKSVRGELLNWAVDLAGEFRVDLDPHDLLELVGIVLENAAQWARREVHIRCVRRQEMAELSIADDGPGMTLEQIAGLGGRTGRLDEATPVRGIGLAIALEIVKLNRGRISFGAAPQGGLLVTIRLPVVDVAPGPTAPLAPVEAAK